MIEVVVVCDLTPEKHWHVLIDGKLFGMAYDRGELDDLLRQAGLIEKKAKQIKARKK